MTRTDLVGVAAAVLVAAAAAAPASAQSLAERVRAVSGDADFRFASRSGVCGDGDRMISFRDHFEMRDEWSRECVPGPVRVRVTVAGHELTRLRTSIGGATGSGVTDLGTVSDREAVDYLLTLARTAPEAVAHEAVMPAALADSTTIAPAFLALARDHARPLKVRKRALFWAGQVDEPGTLDPVRVIAIDAGEEEAMRTHALFVLSQFPDATGVPALIDATRDDREPWFAKKAAFWLGQTDDARASAALRDLVVRAGTSDEVRGEAVFVLGQHESRPEDIAFLRDHFASLPERLQDRALMGIAQHGGTDGARWLRALITNESGALHVRKQALFWAGQGEGEGALSTTDIAALYGALREPEMKKQAIFVLSQRDDSAATTKLMDIARSDPDHDMRKRAMFWLGQKHDPRVSEFLGSILEK